MYNLFLGYFCFPTGYGTPHSIDFFLFLFARIDVLIFVFGVIYLFWGGGLGVGARD